MTNNICDITTWLDDPDMPNYIVSANLIPITQSNDNYDASDIINSIIPAALHPQYVSDPEHSTAYFNTDDYNVANAIAAIINDYPNREHVNDL
tara:strand:+ start:292 stop:570 length:279 start_codon:yes stop_codon:yes gene_type:complete